jgi:hypothetical protein
VRLVEQRGKLAEHRARLRHRGDLDAVFDDGDRAILEDQKLAGFGAFGEHGLVGLIARDRQRGEALLPAFGIVNESHGLISPLKAEACPSIVIAGLRPGNPCGIGNAPPAPNLCA